MSFAARLRGLGAPARLSSTGLCALALCALSGCAIPIIGATGGSRGGLARGAAPLAASVGGVPGNGSPFDSSTREACYERLRASGVAFRAVAPQAASGVRMPTRLEGPIGGIEVRARRAGTKAEVLDCRLALALLSWSPALRSVGVTGVEYYSIYRPGARVRGSGRISGHAHGLAIDAARFYLDDGAVLDVLTDWEERERGSDPCPLRPEEARPSRVLRSVVCDAVARKLFQVVLTPHHDRAHRDHVHLELKPEADWTYVR